MTLKCYFCYDAGKVRDAVVVYDGRSMCKKHLRKIYGISNDPGDYR